MGGGKKETKKRGMEEHGKKGSAGYEASAKLISISPTAVA